MGGERDSAVVMTYGITSSGKTYTMEGTAAQPGLIVRSTQLLFEQLQVGPNPNPNPNPNPVPHGRRGDGAARRRRVRGGLVLG